MPFAAPPQGCALAKKPSLVPPLSRSKLYELEFIETGLRGSLRMCRDNTGKILDYLRSYAVEIFDFYNTSYESVPGYTREWKPQLMVNAIYLVMGCCRGERIGLGYLAEYQEVVFQTLKTHVEQLPRRRTKLSHPATASASQSDPVPELKASTASQLQPRRAFVEPILEEKGWSILEWADEAKVAHATAMDYLQNKTRPYRSTRVKLATALGVSAKQLPK
jgi:lambda repressor-like predicted transcriptional regulator